MHNIEKQLNKLSVINSQPVISKTSNKYYEAIEITIKGLRYSIKFEKPGSISITWTIDDIHQYCYNMFGCDYADLYDVNKFKDILEKIHQNHNAEQGISFRILKEYLDKYAKK
jgi:hypothetical protein